MKHNAAFLYRLMRILVNPAPTMYKDIFV